jgi:trimeric autotransporter adhesin
MASAFLRRPWFSLVLRAVSPVLAATLAASTSAAQSTVTLSPQPLITAPVNDAALYVLKGSAHPRAQQFDAGAAPESMPAQRLLLQLKRSPQQEAALRLFLDSLQDPSSPAYHKFLTPAQFGQYGLGDSDLAAITAWLQSQGFTVDKINQARTMVEFSGNVGQINRAFHTSIRRYVINGNEHYAASTNAAIPAALAPAVSAISSLSNFDRPKAQHTTPRPVRYNFKTHQAEPSPRFTYPVGNNEYQLLVAPADAATIYDINPVYSLQDSQGRPLTGQGVTIGIAGDAYLWPGMVESYRASFGLPPSSPNVVNAGDPPSQGAFPPESDEAEALLDIEISGGIAPGAAINFYTAADSSFQPGLYLAILQALEDNKVNILNVSFSQCEASGDNAFALASWQQAAAQGITVTVSTGDNGSAGCDDPDLTTQAMYGLQVNGLASTPYNIAVGGTDFDQDTATVPTYWSMTNGSNGGSVLSYIPEIPWNDSTTVNTAIADNSASKDPTGATNIVAASGGASGCINPTFAANSSVVCNPVDPGGALLGYAKPAWQVGPGVPQDGVRDLPDVSLFAGNGLHYSAWAICLSTCSQGPTGSEDFSAVGGTSTAAPAFAGMMALLVQKYGPQGQAASLLYPLAAQHPSVFHDVITGNNSVYCVTSSPGCGSNNFLTGYNAQTYFDLATGLGSVDVLQLVNNWGSVTFKPTTTNFTINGSSSPLTITHGTGVSLSALVTAAGGTPSGAVAIINNSNASGNSAEGTIPLNAGIASVTGYTDFPGGTYTAFASYGGDGVFSASRSQGIQLTVTPEDSVLEMGAEIFSQAGQGSSIAGQSVPLGTYISVWARPIASSQQNEQIPTARATGSVTFTDSLAGQGLSADGLAFIDSTGMAEVGLHYLVAGVHTIGATYPGDPSFGKSAAGPLTFTVTKASTATALVASTSSIAPSGSVDLHATLSSSSVIPVGAVAPYPGGTVSFNLGSTVLGSSPISGALNPGGGSYSFTAAITVPGTALQPGANSITASYSGDNSFASSVSIPAVVTVAVPPPPPPGILLSFYRTSQGAPQGQPLTMTVSVLSQNGFTGAIALTCSVTGQSGAQDIPTCSFDPGNLSVVDASIAVKSVLTITSTAPSSAAVKKAGRQAWGSVGGATLACVLLGFLPKRRSPRQVVLLLFCLLLTFGLSSCGGGGGGSTTAPTGGGSAGSGNPGTTAGNYKVTVTATSGSITATNYTTFVVVD